MCSVRHHTLTNGRANSLRAPVRFLRLGLRNDKLPDDKGVGMRRQVLAMMLIAVGVPGVASAQSSIRLELEGGVWNPSRELVISTKTTGCRTSTRPPGAIVAPSIACTDPTAVQTSLGFSGLDLVRAFVLGRSASSQFRAVATIARRHKIRLSVLPTAYAGTTNLSRPVSLQGASFGIGARITTHANWTFLRFGYEWDAIRRNRGFLGIVADLNHSGISFTVDAPTFNGSTQTGSYDRTINVATAGVAGELRLMRYLSLAGDVAMMRLDNPRAGVFTPDVNVFATIDLRRNIGVRVGYRSVKFDYELTKHPDESTIVEDAGSLKMQAPYLGAVFRF